MAAVKDLCLEINPGECFGLLGPNGAGKSTTINCITGFFPPSQGRVSLCGFDVHRQPKAARRHLGVCSQEDTLDTDFSVFQQLVRHASFFGLSRKVCEERAQRLLERFELTDRKDSPIESLSGGMRRKVQVARAFLGDPKVVVLDEPTTGLDPQARHVLWDALAEYRSRGVAILLSTHYMEEAERLCDRVGVLHRGHLLDCDSPSALIRKHVGDNLVEETLRAGVIWKRPPNLEDVFLKVTGAKLASGTESGE